MKEVYAYIRVSTVKQGEKGSSLQEQRDAIVTYARRCDLRITDWFEEMETAAKAGRRQFARMLKLLERGKARGVILHKIDRGARNLKDWANLRELSELGIEVHLAHESIDLSTRGGALSADIQAVIAADYIRNLRDEVKKGLYGRFKQGIYPFRAPIGYLDRGGGAIKEVDPARAPLVRQAFELYANGAWSLKTLSVELERRGLRSRTGKIVSAKRLSTILNDPFYIGMMEVKRNGRLFAGNHEPLVSKALFDRVAAVLAGGTNTHIQKRAYLFRRLVKCEHCGYSLIGELQKGHVYYRCHTPACPTKCVREELVDECLRHAFAHTVLTDEECRGLREMALAYKARWATEKKSLHEALSLQRDNIQGRLTRLMDTYLDGEIDKVTFEEKNRALLLDRKGLDEKMAALDTGQWSVPDEVLHHLELSQTLPLSYGIAQSEEKRDIVAKLTSNLIADGKNVAVKLRSPFHEIANRHALTKCGLRSKSNLMPPGHMA